MKKLLIYTSVLLLMSCSKSESDFIGEYEFMNLKHLQVPSSLGSIFSRNPKSTAQEFDILGNVKISLFIDESDKMLKGEMNYVEASVETYTTYPTVKRTRYDFDLKNMRIVSDTLVFSISNQMTELSSKSFRGFIYKDDQTQYVGIDNELVGRSKYRENNPWFISNDEEMTVFKTGLNSQVERQFYKNQIEDLSAQLEDKTVPALDRQTIENSITYLEKNHLAASE